jgi:hypothetical protein
VGEDADDREEFVSGVAMSFQHADASGRPSACLRARPELNAAYLSIKLRKAVSKA